MTTTPSESDYERIGNLIADQTLDRIRGRHRPYCAFDRPQDEYFAASVAPRDPDGEQEFTESRPNHVGLKCKPTTESLGLEVAFSVYLPSFPTREEFEEISSRTATEDDGHGLFDPGTVFFRRVDIEYETELDLSATDAETDRVVEELHQRLDRAVDRFVEEHLLVSHDRRESDAGEIALSDPDEFDTFRERMADWDSVRPSWDVGFDVVDRGDEVIVRLENDTEEDESRETDPFLFDPVIALTGNFESYTLNQIPEDYRYDRQIWAKGQNCSTTSESRSEGGRRRVTTTNVPEHQSYRFVQNDDYRDATALDRLSDPDAFLGALEEIEAGMSQYLSDWRGPRAREFEARLTEEEMEEFHESADQFEQEIQYFRDGIEVLEEVPMARRAFVLMNRAFARQSGAMTNWYLFQIVFIVSNLGAIVSREFPSVASDKDDMAEVLWFPTGGGKTEAYLGLIVFALLFDRLRGKERGVTAWIRFPLRLLGKQQKDRFMSILNEADRIRREDIDGSGEPFSVGYFVGSHDTPNSIRHEGRNNYWETFQSDQDTLREKCQVVDECPECGTAVDVEFDPEENSVAHVCPNDGCDLDRLPIHVTDHDIYRSVPSVLLGTLDKIAITGANPRFTNLLGNFTDECPVHGYGYAGKCSEANTVDCNEELESVPEEDRLYDPIPSLHLIDEVHLLSEELGVFAGQYETLYLELCRQLSPDGHEPKVLTSTATISEYEEQMRNLFLKDANRFPEEGPTKDESFYGAVDYEQPERRYLGITPVNKTHIYAVLDLAKKYHQTIRDMRSSSPDELPGEVGDDLDPAVLEEVLDVYELSVVYFLRKTEKDRFLRSMENQINREMAQDGYETPIRTDQLTADIDSTEILDELADPDETFEERPDTVAATSFIGHGIDVDRFNAMMFFGFPTETFQYVQASARVGREYPGTVFDVFKPFDERDKHRYKYFEKTHEYLRRSIEAVSIDRWSKFSIEKTYAGLFKALLIQYYRPLMHREYQVNVQSSRELSSVLDSPDEYPEFSRDRYQALLKRAYGLHLQDDEYFERRVQEKTESYWEFWIKRLQRENYTTFKEEPMRSLRDIGDQVDISIDSDEGSFYGSLVGGD